MKHTHFVIAGNGGAAISAVMAIRSSGFAGEITMISDVDGPAFNPMLSPYFLKGIIPWESCFPFDPTFYRDFAVTCRFGTPIESIDAVNQKIGLSDGLNLNYDRCLIATGANAVIPPVPGLDDSRKAFVLRTPESTKKLDEAMASARKAIVLGASFVGLKIAEILRKRCIDVVVLDVMDQILPRGAHPLVAARLREYFEKQEVDIRLGCAMEGMESSGDEVTCRFSDDIFEEADFVVVSTGTRPNLGFLIPGQVNVDQGILVDIRMKTSASNLFAAGDVCQSLNALTGLQECFGTWQSARLQGKIAGLNMIGFDAFYRGSIQENISPFFDWTYAQIGDIQGRSGKEDYVFFEYPDSEAFGIVVIKERIMTGANLINCTHLAGEIRRAIARREPFDSITRASTPLHDLAHRLEQMTYPYQIPLA
jgi:NADPH-dependent 2,4-dienoyl-CoA reductase/sulfur reductase-like enzyme